MTLAVDVRNRRIQLRLSQSRLSRLASVSRYKLNVFEAGGSLLRPEEIARIDAALYQEKQSLLDGLRRSEPDQFPADAAQLRTLAATRSEGAHQASGGKVA